MSEKHIKIDILPIFVFHKNYGGIHKKIQSFSSENFIDFLVYQF